MLLTRLTIDSKSIVNPSTFIPKRWALLIISDTSALCMSNLEGTQPRLRHVPPILSFSITATLRPCWYTAFATSKPEPLPITIRSNVFVLDTQVMGIFYSLYLFLVYFVMFLLTCWRRGFNLLVLYLLLNKM